MTEKAKLPERLTLKTVVDSLSKRLKATELATLPKEETNTITGKPTLVSMEVKYTSVPSERVLSALNGLKCAKPLKKVVYPGATFTHEGLYYHNGSKLGFTMRVRRYRDGSLVFFLTTIKFEQKVFWLTKKEGQVKMRSDAEVPKEAPKDALDWDGISLKELIDQIGQCGSFVTSHHNGKCIEAVVTL